MKLVNVVQRQRYQRDLESFIKVIAPELLHSDNYKAAVEKMVSIGLVSRGEKTYFNIKLEAKIILLIIEALLADHGFDMNASISMIDKENRQPGSIGTLVHLSGPHMPDEYVEAVDGYAMTHFTGTCGRAIYKNHVVSCYDVFNNELFVNFWGIYATYGIQSVLSFPVRVDGEVIGTLSLFSTEQLKEHNDKIIEIVEPRIEGLENVFASLQEAWEKRDVLSWKYILSSDSTVFYVEEPVNEGLGYLPQECIGKDLFTTYVHPEDREETLRDLECVIRKHKTKRSIHRIKAKDGKYIMAETLFVPITDHKELRYIECFIAINTKACKEFEAIRYFKSLNGASLRNG